MSASMDIPELIANRVSRAYSLEPLRMLGQGVAGVDEMDKIMRSLGGFRTGPFEHMDLVGVDADHALTRRVWEQLGKPARLRPHAIQAGLIEQRRLGRKTRQGFYAYDRGPPLPAAPVDRRSFDAPPGVYKAVRRFADRATAEHGSFTELYVLARTLVAVINEAALVIDEGVAAETDVDAAMKQLENYPRGPLEWAEQIGRHTCASLLRRLNERVDDGRFEPADWLNA
jgi:3-hydroxybutyryl-CoA dehydrogenase